MHRGLPRSWPHYVYGMQHLGREHARASLRAAGSAGIAHANREEAERWYRAQRSAAGW